jgi:serine/threonine-protein kinase
MIERAISGPTTAGGSFEDEQQEFAWKRCRLLFLAGLAVAALGGTINVFVPSGDPGVVSPLTRFEWASGAWAHVVSLIIGLGLLYLRRDHSKVYSIAFGIVSINVVLVIYNGVAFHPATETYFGLSLLLFLSAALIPWRPAFQISLGALAVVMFLLLGGVLYAVFPEYRSFWAEYARASGGTANAADLMRSQTIWGVTGSVILGGTSALVSQTLYSLRKTAHRAKRLGKYLIREEIGKGGMGQVFFAQHSLMCRPTAVKVMAADGDSIALARFEREIKLSATLTHPNTITIYDVGRTPERSLYYAMEYLEGLDLEVMVERFGPIRPERAVFILKQVCGSLAEAHSRDIVHRDIKPSNIFVTRRGGIYDYVKVLDFGLAKQITADTASGITQTGIVFGTPRYLAPETVLGSGEVDGRADIYNLGGVAYWMVTGQPPFEAASSVELLVDHVKTPPRPPSEVSEISIPSELEAIILKCLDKKPDDRFQTATELEDALDALSFAEPWTKKLAEKWWDLHGILGDEPHDCDCFFHEEAVSGEERPVVIADLSN